MSHPARHHQEPPSQEVLTLADVRLPPHSVEAEQSVLGAILFNPESMHKVVDLIKPDDFYRGPHKHIYAAMCQLYKLNEPLDIITLAENMDDAGTLDAGGGRPYLMDLAMSVATSENITYYAKIIKEKAIKRGLITVGNDIADLGYDESSTAKALDMAQQGLFQLCQQGEKRQSASIMDILPDTYSQILERHENKGTLMGIGSGFYDLDSYTSGFQKSDLIILAARPSMGKTAFCLNIVSNVAMREKKPVLVFSLEMSKEQLVQRMLCAEAEVDAQKIKTGELSNIDFERLSRGMTALSEAAIHIDDTPGLSVMEMRAKARQVQMETGQPLGLIVIDYLQLMEGPSSGDGNRTQEISVISRGLKGLARELKVPVIALSQLSRAVESRQDKRPMLSDLRESGAIEQDADLVMFIYRDEYYNKDSDRPGTADIIIAKHRNGPVGDVELLFRHSITRFMNPADRRLKVF